LDPGWLQRFPIDPNTHGFRIGPISPGTYVLELQGDVLARVDLGTHTLIPHQSLDLGEFEIPAPASLHIDLKWPAGHANRGLRTGLRDDEGRRWGAVLSGGLFQTEPLPPGRFELRIYGPFEQWQEVRFDLAPGEDKRIEVAVIGGRPVRFSGRLPSGSATPDLVPILVTDSLGARVAELHISSRLFARGTESCGFAPGTYRASSRIGEQTAITEFLVPTGFIEPIEVVLEYH
jgi:hypothetical protein